ncbi:MAG: emp24/gp25L/p24 family protein [Candidatus Bathyarchaeota archaeon]|nr:emp24/gp25L/p24 family protein [Candidatus Bathyarchaeota archaeon]
MNRFFTVLCSLIALVLLAGVVNAYSSTFELPAGNSVTKEVDLNAEDVVSGRVTIVGKAINFSVSDPVDTVISNYTVNGHLDFSFTAAKVGTYRFSFENLYSEEVTFVTLNYNVQHYIFGFPQEFALLFIIVGVAVVGVVIFIAMSPKP